MGCIHQHLEFAMPLFFLNTQVAYEIFLSQDFLFFSELHFTLQKKENAESSEKKKKKKGLSLIIHELIPECRKK